MAARERERVAAPVLVTTGGEGRVAAASSRAATVAGVTSG